MKSSPYLLLFLCLVTLPLMVACGGGNSSDVVEPPPPPPPPPPPDDNKDDEEEEEFVIWKHEILTLDGEEQDLEIDGLVYDKFEHTSVTGQLTLDDIPFNNKYIDLYAVDVRSSIYSIEESRFVGAALYSPSMLSMETPDFDTTVAIYYDDILYIEDIDDWDEHLIVYNDDSGLESRYGSDANVNISSNVYVIAVSSFFSDETGRYTLHPYTYYNEVP